MKQWEYKIIDNTEAPRDSRGNFPDNDELTDYFNILGEQWWELVSVLPYDAEGGIHRFRIFFKRSID